MKEINEEEEEEEEELMMGLSSCWDKIEDKVRGEGVAVEAIATVLRLFLVSRMDGFFWLREWEHILWGLFMSIQLMISVLFYFIYFFPHQLFDI